MEKQFDCIKLNFSSPLHLSRGRENYDESAKLLHSDTLAAALFVAALHVGASENETLAMLDSVRISSAFPFCREEYFFPKPLARLPFPIKGVPEEKLGKPYKRIRFLGKTWFEKMLHGEKSEIDHEKHLHKKEFLTEYSSLATVFKTDVIQRVTIPPDHSGDAVPFYTERIFFGKEAGLFLLVEWQDNSAKGLFFRSLRLLGDLGIGTDRSVGNGFFTPKTTTLCLNLPDKADHQCSMGLYLPSERELSEEDLEESSWSLIKRGGYIAGAQDQKHITLRKRSVFMFEEGSIFPNKPLEGKKVNLKPNWEGLHAVWREGRPIFLPIIKMP